MACPNCDKFVSKPKRGYLFAVCGKCRREGYQPKANDLPITSTKKDGSTVSYVTKPEKQARVFPVMTRV